MMQSARSREEASSHKSGWRRRLRSFGLLTIFGLGFFLFGWAAGSGIISLPGRGVASENKDLPQRLDYSSVNQVYDILRRSYDGKLELEALMDGLKNGLAGATGDPYTEYFNADQAKEFDNELNGTFSGIGAELSREDDLIVIVAPIEGFPAEKAGLKPKDIITEINGQQTYGMSLTEAVQSIRGPADSEVTLQVVRENEAAKDYTITRQDITIPSVEYDLREDGVGYLRISRFADDTVKLTTQAAESLKQQGAKSIILDLRGNPGGRLDGAVDVASLWLNKSQTVLEERRGGVTIKTYKATGNNILEGMPTVVLIDEGSASASEIVAGALKDNGAAQLIGVTSFGKGSVQGLEQVPSGGILKVTIARWYTPHGHNIDKQGIAPDETVKISAEQVATDQDPQLVAAERFLKK